MTAPPVYRAMFVRGAVAEPPGRPMIRAPQLMERRCFQSWFATRYYLHLDPKQVLRAKPYPPLATLQVVALLRKAGHQVAFFDAMVAEGVDEYDLILRTSQPQLVLFYEDNFNFLSKMCLGAMRDAACEMIESARRAGARVIAAGPDVTDAPGPYLKAGADLALIGEGLSALLEVLPRLDSDPAARGADLANGLAGVISLGGGSALTRGGSKAVPIAADVGLAAWDLVDMDRYRATWLKAHGYFSLNMAASRGCPFRCAWCAKPIWATNICSGMRPRSPRKWPTSSDRSIRITSGLPTISSDFGSTGSRSSQLRCGPRTRRFLSPSKPGRTWSSERMAEVLHDAGCREAWIGAESGSQRVLDAMNKGTTVAEILLARHRLKAAGIRVGFFIQLGYMDEELADILATRDLLDAARPDEIGVSVSYPLPGTKFYDLVKAQLGGKTHWQDSNDLEMMFQGTYTSDFYRAVRNLLHDQITLQTEGLPVDGEEYGRARTELDQRWQELLSWELQYRSPARQAAAAG